MTNDDELLDLVDASDNVTSTILRSQTSNLKANEFLRAAELFIQNSHRQLWIPRRGRHKRIAPGGLDYSASGHIAAGESYITGCIREVEEELNLLLTEKDLLFIRKFPPIRDLSYFRTVYLYYSDKVPSYNPNDFDEYYWLTPEQLLEKLKAGEPAKRSLAETAAYLIKHNI